jgi:putative DNA primase/helicase
MTDQANQTVPTEASKVPSLDEEILRLSKLSRVEYELERYGVAERFDIRVTALDAEVAARQPKAEKKSGQGQEIEWVEPKPWDEPVDGALLIDDIVTYIRRFVIMSEPDYLSVALWVLASYAFKEFFIFPRLLIKSPEKGCGKSTLMDLISRLVKRPIVASNMTAAPLFRIIELQKPTVLLDEADAYLRNSEDLRTIVNAGHKKDGAVFRCVGDDHEPRAFNVFCPMVISGIGSQRDTIEDRSIIIHMKRKMRDQVTEPFRTDKPGDAEILARQCARWVEDERMRLGGADPTIPKGVYNRAADNWRPLLAVAETIGGALQERARVVSETKTAEASSGENYGTILLADIRMLFAEYQPQPLFSDDIVKFLRAREDRPWGDMDRGRGLTTHKLARLLKPFGIGPQQIKINGSNLRGYRADQFTDAWARYLEPMPTAIEILNTPMSSIMPPAQSATSEPGKCSKPARLSSTHWSLESPMDQVVLHTTTRGLEAEIERALFALIQA